VSPEKDYYRVLGVPRNATPEEIKQRYREMVRKYHPDVNPDKTTGHQTFVEISEAYRILNDPGLRAAHNLDLDRRTARQQERVRPTSGQSSGPRAAPRQPPQPPPVERMLANARELMAQRRLRDAASLCRQVLARDRSNVRAYKLLGDIYASVGRNDDAMAMYTYAQQYAPNDVDVMRAMNRLLAKEARQNERIARAARRDARSPNLLIGAGWLVGAALFVMSFGFAETEPLAWFSLFDRVPQTTLLLLMADTALAGLLLSAGNALGRFDDEMIFPSRERGRTPGPPVGLFIPLAAILSFYVAVVFYGVYAFMQEQVSPSVVKAFAVCLIMVGLFALPHPDAAGQLLLWGAGPAFCTFCFGWLVADAFRPNW
jgi:curved DNA-binding protein CbpA